MLVEPPVVRQDNALQSAMRHGADRIGRGERRVLRAPDLIRSRDGVKEGAADVTAPSARLAERKALGVAHVGE
jgi:hypothetical protein